MANPHPPDLIYDDAMGVITNQAGGVVAEMTGFRSFPCYEGGGNDANEIDDQIDATGFELVTRYNEFPKMATSYANAAKRAIRVDMAAANLVKVLDNQEALLNGWSLVDPADLKALKDALEHQPEDFR